MTTSKRQLGVVMATALVLGNMIGSRVFLLPASLATYGGYGLIGWSIASASRKTDQRGVENGVSALKATCSSRPTRGDVGQSMPPNRFRTVSGIFPAPMPAPRIVASCSPVRR